MSPLDLPSAREAEARSATRRADAHFYKVWYQLSFAGGCRSPRG